MAGAHRITTPLPELRIWIKEPAQQQGYGREAVAVLRDRMAGTHRPQWFYHLATEQNLPSHRIAQSLGGIHAGIRQNSKFRTVVYLLPVPARDRHGVSAS